MTERAHSSPGSRAESDKLSQPEAQPEVTELNPGLAALAWENFLKTLANHGGQGEAARKAAEQEARQILLEELVRLGQVPPEKVSQNLPLSANIEDSVGDLIAYLKGELSPARSKLAQSQLPELQAGRTEHEDGKEFWLQREQAKIDYQVAERALAKILFQPPRDQDLAFVSYRTEYDALKHELAKRLEASITYENSAAIYREHEQKLVELKQKVQQAISADSRQQA